MDWQRQLDALRNDRLARKPKPPSWRREYRTKGGAIQAKARRAAQQDLSPRRMYLARVQPRKNPSKPLLEGERAALLAPGKHVPRKIVSAEKKAALAMPSKRISAGALAEAKLRLRPKRTTTQNASANVPEPNILAKLMRRLTVRRKAQRTTPTSNSRLSGSFVSSPASRSRSPPPPPLRTSSSTPPPPPPMSPPTAQEMRPARPRIKATKGPKKAARGPKKAARGPKKAAKGPKKAARGPKKAARGPKKAARGPKKAARGPKKAAKGASNKKGRCPRGFNKDRKQPGHVCVRREQGPKATPRKRCPKGFRKDRRQEGHVCVRR
jgi:hypothetical protein